MKPASLPRAPEPATAVVEGPAYPPLVKAIASVMVLLLAIGAAQVMLAPDGAWRASLDWATGLMLLAVLAVVVAGWWVILASRTRFDGERFTQTGLWRREVDLREVSQAKLIFIPGLAWIVVPRLVLRTRGLAMATFTAGNGPLLQAMQSLMLARGGR